MPQIPFTEYVRPNGLRRDIYIDRPQSIYDKALAIRKQGLALTLEKLPWSDVSLCIADTFEEEDLSILIVKNNQDAINAGVDTLISEFDLTTYISRAGETPTLDESFEDEVPPSEDPRAYYGYDNGQNF
jgi:hypothetical protein